MQIRSGATIKGRYRILHGLARGGMSSVWVALDVPLGRKVAVKFVEGRSEDRERIEQRMLAAVSLRSEHNVTIRDVGFEGDVPYLVMELLEGEDLATRLQRGVRTSWSDTARILAQIGKALGEAHEAGIVHAHLDLGNVFIARIDGREVVKVLDFGFAAETAMTSPYYRSPEQVRGDGKLDHRADLWSLGVILYRMLVGTLPFPGPELGQVLYTIVKAAAPPPSKVAPDLPRSMDAFFARALARDKEQRFQSIDEMVEAFEGAAKGTKLSGAAPISDTSRLLAFESISLLILSFGLWGYANSRVTFRSDSPSSDIVMVEDDPRFRRVEERRFPGGENRPDLLIRVEYPKEMRENETQHVLVAVQWDSRGAAIGDHWAEVRSGAFDVSAPMRVKKRLGQIPSSFLWTITPKHEGTHEIILDSSLWRLPGTTLFSYTDDAYTSLPQNGSPLVAKILVRTIWGISRTTFDGLMILLAAIGALLAVPYVKSKFKSVTVNVIGSTVGGIAVGKGSRGAGTVKSRPTASTTAQAGPQTSQPTTEKDCPPSSSGRPPPSCS